MSGLLDFRSEWLDAPGVTTPELAATWGRYEISVGGRPVTQVEAADGTYRRGVYGSLYPLAFWIASNWWPLAYHLRPTAVEGRLWDWQHVRTQPWLRQHNFRAAGDGMAWPNLTIVPEGPVAQVTWRQDYERSSGLVRFASDGRQWLPGEDLRTDLAGIVGRVLDRLTEMGLQKTPLAEEWAEIAAADARERDFCRTAARLGLDPYSVEDDLADGIIAVADVLPAELADNFFDSVTVPAVREAAGWARQAASVAEAAAARAAETIRAIQESASVRAANRAGQPPAERPWFTGWELARAVRHELSVPDTDSFDASPWVGIGHVGGSSYGIYGLAAVTEDRCGVVLGDPHASPTARRFGQARALGRILTRPGQHQFVLSTARSQDERVARAFAAELLAPAAGIRSALDDIGSDGDDALDSVAAHFKVSPLLIRHQYDNQLAS
jgi:hypothetical protein